MRKSIVYLVSLSLVSLVCLLNPSSLKAQADNGLFSDIAIGAEAGTMGFGISGAVSLSPNFKLKLGYMNLPFTYKDDIEMNATRLRLFPGGLKILTGA